ncbi:MAG TPA: CoA transferase [Dehalococcoidia bacterium]|nr:CoA transferase [Dehalococcoidia bacterium]
MSGYKLPLEGIRVIDMTVVWAGPFATVLLGDMGAELIRVDSLQYADVNTRGQPIVPPAMLASGMGQGYPNRDPGPRPWNRHAQFNQTGRHKKSFTVDLKRPKGREIFFRLVQQSDIFIENNAADVIENLDITYEVLSKVNPQLIMMSLPAFGRTGPYKHFKAYGVNMEAVVGHTWLRTYTDSDPTSTTAAFLADAAGGASAVFAALSALHYRMKTGRGQNIDMSQSENVMHCLSQAVMDYSMNGRVQGTMGNGDPARAPQGAYPCAGEDSWVAISCGDDEEFKALCAVMGQPSLAEDPRFADSLSRYRNQDALDPIIGAWTADRVHYEVFHTLQKAGVTAGPILKIAEVFHDPHLLERGFWETVTHPEAGTHVNPGPIIEMTKTPLHIRSAPPLLGEHNEYVYKDILGYAEAEYQQLIAEDFIGDTYIVARKQQEAPAST